MTVCALFELLVFLIQTQRDLLLMLAEEKKARSAAENKMLEMSTKLDTLSSRIEKSLDK